MHSSNCQTAIPTALPNQSTCCPWTSRAPLATAVPVKQDSKSSEINFPETSVNCQRTVISQSCSNNHQQINPNELTHTEKPSAPLHCTSIQQSSSQFFHFLRLMQLFPDVHPATLHTVLILCKNDFLNAVDKLLYAKRCKQLYNSRKNLLHRCNSTSKCNRFQPYCYVVPTANSNVTQNDQQQCTSVLQGFSGHIAPLDVSVKRAQTNLNEASTSGGTGSEGLMKAKPMEARKVRNRVKTRGKLAHSLAASATDLAPVASPQCKLPISPLSPISGLPEDLSHQPELTEDSANC